MGGHCLCLPSPAYSCFLLLDMASVVATRFLSVSLNLLPRTRHVLLLPRRLGYCVARSTARGFSSSLRRLSPDDEVTVHFINRDGDELVAKGKVGESLLDLVVEKNLDIDGFGACEGTLACSTCHLIFTNSVYRQLEPVTDEEMDMLDLAYGLTDTSRLGCQICLTKAMEGMTVRVPEAVADARQAMDADKNS
ncbi:adrenodoxin, mitochondrial isoform X2 [Ambystoma mexicanum]|uniref:adrenodoxin, mitochondrial isoform X2 n=1 Tax=Ambystoma mexicanum TaxID=8296 RepID=UPI0037E97A82